MQSPVSSDNPLVIKINSISEQAQLLNAFLENTDKRSVKLHFNRLLELMQEFHDLVMTLPDKSASADLKETIVHHIRKVETIVNNYDSFFSASDIAKISDTIFSLVMALVTSLRFYLSATEASSKTNSRSSFATISNLRRSRSQLTLDIMNFAKSCSGAISYLKSTSIDRITLGQHMASILTAVKDLISDESFNDAIHKTHMSKFIEVVKELRSLEIDNLVGNEIVQRIMRTLQPMASDIKKAAFDLQSDSLRQHDTSIFAAPLHYKHDIPSTELFGARNSSQSFSSNSLADLSLRQSFYEATSASESHSSRPRLSSTLSTLDISSNAFYSTPNLDIQNTYEEESAETKEKEKASRAVVSLTPLSVDITSKNMTFIIELEATYHYLQNGKYSHSKIYKKSEGEIAILWNSINAILPNYLPKFSFDNMRKIPSKETMKQVVLSEYAIFFQALNNKPHLLKSHYISSFLSDKYAVSSKSMMSPLRNELKNKDQQGQFLTLSISKDENPYATYQEHTNSSISPTKKSKFSLSSKAFQKDTRSRSWDNLLKRSSKEAQPTEKPLKLSALFKSSSQHSLFGTLKTNIGESDKRPKSDPVRQNTIFKALSFAEKDKQTGPTKFQSLSAILLKKGFQKTDAETLILRNSDQEDVVIIKDTQDGPRIHAATLDMLISYVLNNTLNDDVLFHCFVLTYKHLLKPFELLIKLVEKYKTSAEEKDVPAEVEQMKVAVFLEKWIEVSWTDFDRDVGLKSSLEKFINIVRNSAKVSLMSEQIRKTMQKQIDIHAMDPSLSELSPKKAFITNVGSAEFVTFDPTSIAVQMTKYDYELFQKIRSSNFIEYLWEKEDKSGPLKAWIERFNLVCYWVGTEICTTPLLKQRIQIVENMIKLLKALKDLNNFNGMMAVISGLNMASIRRLSKTWAGLNSKAISQLHEIEKSMDPKMNYQTYREIENKLRGVQSSIPFLGLYLKDLTFTNDGNPKYLQNGLVNFSKNWSIFDMIQRVRSFQELSYDFPEDEKTFDYCTKLIALPEKRLYSYSLLCEQKTISKTLNTQKEGDNTMRLIEKWSTSNQ